MACASPGRDAKTIVEQAPKSSKDSNRIVERAVDRAVPEEFEVGLWFLPHPGHCRRRFEKHLEDDLRVKSANVRLSERSRKVRDNVRK